MDESEIQRYIREAHMPPRFHGLYRRSLEGGSRATAVKVKCLDCVGWEDAVARVRDCEVVTCPLHAVRPYQNKGVEPEEMEVEAGEP